MEDAESGRQGMDGGDPSRTQSLNPVTGRGPPRRETGGRAEISQSGKGQGLTVKTQEEKEDAASQGQMR